MAGRDRITALFEHLGEPAVEVGFDDVTPIVRRVNRAFVSVFGVEKATIIDEPLDEYIVGDDGRETAEEINRIAAEGTPVEREVCRQAADGPRWFLFRSVPFTAADEQRGYGIYIDITQRKRQRERFQTLIEHSSDIITVLDAEGNYQYQSPSVERILGYDPDDRLGETAFEYVHPDDREAVRAEFERAISDPSLTPTAEYRIRDATGMWHWLASKGSNQLDNPAVEGFVVNSRDITERKERERKLDRRNERLEKFVGIVSHDLRNPLNVANGYVTRAAEECDSDHLDRVAASLDRMDELIDDTLTLAKQGRTVGETEPVDLTALANDCWRTVDTEDADLVVEDPPTVEADRERLRTAVENLFHNAVVHGGEDVTVRVGANADGFYVSDDGPGIPASKRERVFESGYSTTDGGTGFGLDIVSAIVEAHGWTITVGESDDGGARFDVSTDGTLA
ncbi:MAG: PAS domain S-box protein [Haloplanus sp.]